MSSYRLTPAARQDLSEIWDYTAERWDESQAGRYLTELRAAAERIAEDPRRGRACDEVRPGYRRYAIGSHVLFYRERSDGQAGADIIRVLHQSMDPTRRV